MREMLLKPKDMENLVTEKVTYTGDGDIIFTLSENKFIILRATDLYETLEIRATQVLEENYLMEQLAAAGVMSQEELEQWRRKQEREWIKARRAGLKQQRADLDARIARMEEGR